VFPVRYELHLYILIRRSSILLKLFVFRDKIFFSVRSFLSPARGLHLVGCTRLLIK
jgi:hypothetical protein